MGSRSTSEFTVGTYNPVVSAIGRKMIASGQRLSVSSRRLLIFLDEFLDACFLEVAHVHGRTP
jgi:hypothetical protein